MKRNNDGIMIHGPDGFEGMRKAGRLVAECLDMLVEEVKIGVKTVYLDNLVREFVYDHGAESATIGYRGYRHASCISLNEVVCHGIPGDRILQDKDILNIDVTLILDGWHGDHSRMFACGIPTTDDMKLMDAAYDGMMAGIASIKPGSHLNDIGDAISKVARSVKVSVDQEESPTKSKKKTSESSVSVVEDFCGHGLGMVFHDEPKVVHSAQARSGPKLEAGMFFTIEPMLNAGGKRCKILNDNWTAITDDYSSSAQYEHSVGVTEKGVEVFTLSPKGLHTPHRLN